MSTDCHDKSRGMHCKAWDQLGKPKAECGLGFKDIEAFNIALLGKQLWRMITQKDMLVARSIRANTSARQTPHRPTWIQTRKSIHAAQSLIRQGVRIVVGNGADISIWQHQRIQSQLPRAPNRYLKLENNIIPGTSLRLAGQWFREWRKDVLLKKDLRN